MKVQNKNTLILLVCIITGMTGLFAQDQKIRDEELSAKFRQLMDSYQYGQACQVAGQLLSNDSLNVELLTMKGRALAADFKVQQAKDVFTTAYILDTANTVTLFELVNVCRQLGDSKQAINYCQRIVDLHPENVFFTIHLSNLYYGIEDFRMAKDILLPLYRIDSLNVYVMKQLANSYNELQQADSAITFYVKYLDMVPTDDGMTGKLTNLYIRKRDYHAGLYLTEMFLVQDSINTGILKLNAYCHYLMKDYQAAAQRFSKCIQLGDKSKFTFKYFGLAFYRQEMYDLAEPLFRLAYQADTADIEVCFYYGVSAYRSALPDTGVVYLEKTLQLLLPEPQFLKTVNTELAGAYTANGQADTALIILISAYKANPDQATLAFNIAYQYDYYLRKPFKALPYYNEFLKKCPETEKTEVNTAQRRSYYEYTVNRVKEINGK
jgi:lipopolysaccharide biosynthesis regulator YciM